ncbi:hypothetical protein [Microbacterium sp.]|uniref:hypothetical protein n=1 Tax=Microbacterium sp. TaxID=51671 RepID=UPI003F9897E1
MYGDQDDMATASNGRPTEAECWKEFWHAVATLWLDLPPEIQREYAETYPKGSKGRPAPVSPAGS